MIDEDDIPTGEVELEEERRALSFADQLEFHALVEELLQHEDTRIIDFETYKPAPDVIVSTIEAGIGLTVPEAILSFFQSISDGFDLEWSYLEEGEERPGGQIGIYNFARVFGTWLDELWGVFEDQSREDFTWEIRGLEKPVAHLNELQTVLHHNANTREFSLYYYAARGPNFRLKVDFLEYIELLKLSRGFFGWQLLISDADFDDFPVAAEVAERFHRVMPRLFPKDDFSRFRKA